MMHQANFLFKFFSNITTDSFIKSELYSQREETKNLTSLHPDMHSDYLARHEKTSVTGGHLLSCSVVREILSIDHPALNPHAADG